MAVQTVLPTGVELRGTLPGGGALVLRRPVAADAPGVLAQCVDPETVRWTSVPDPYTAADAEAFLAHVDAQWEAGAVATLAIEVDGAFAGSVDLRLREAGWASVGYGLGPWARGRGVMTTALRLALRWGFDELGLVGVHWSAHVGNEASRRTALASGFRVEGEVRGLICERGRRIDGWIGSVVAGDPLEPAPPAEER